MAARRPGFEVDGVTGRLVFDGLGQRIERSAVPSEVRDGQLVPRAAPPALAVTPPPPPPLPSPPSGSPSALPGPAGDGQR
jgi:hypothetical protein